MIKDKSQNLPLIFYADELEMDHIIPWSRGGRAELSNAQLLCKVCNIKKSNVVLNEN
jgi:5-methylcytosine-specific restriction endonuclease McrA